MEVREPIVAYNKSRFTIEEYLQYEKESDEKHEYYDGEIFLRLVREPGTIKLPRTFRVRFLAG